MSDSEGRRGRFTPLRKLSDDELAVAAAGGDDKAFALLFERLQDPLYRYCMSILGNPEEARDALQNAMLKAYRALRGETREIAVRPWLYRIARNESVSALRGRRPLGDLEEAVGAAAAGAGVDAAARERLSELVAGLRSLPERQRSALVLRELSGLDYDQLGAALDISPNAARQTVFKARVSMQANVEGRTAHCDEVRAAMSKSDGRFRRRRSIQAHLERCPVCTEFAQSLENRPRELAALFPPLAPGVAAAVLAGATGGGAAGAGAGGAASSGAAASEAASESSGAGAGPAAAASSAAADYGDEPDRRRRSALVPLLLLLLLLIGGTVGTALVLESGEDENGSDQVAQQTETAEAEQGDAQQGDSGTSPGRSRERERGEGEGGSGSRGSGESGSESEGSAEDAPERSRDGRAQERDGSGSSGERKAPGPTTVECVESTRARTSPAQEGYSNRGGRIEVEVTEDCTEARRAPECVPGGGSGSRACVRAGGGDLPITGLQLGLIGGCAFLLLGLGIGLRRLSRA